MFITSLPRSRLLKHLPQGGVMAEVGVFNGGFARQVAALNKPSKQHLIDPWGQDDEPSPQRDRMEERFEAVSQHFAGDVEKGRVSIHRGYSYKVFPTFPDEYFDWVYVDALHTYQAAKEDLELAAPKVKRDGLILGHDFTNSPHSRRRKFGVVRAVRDFLESNGGRLLLITHQVDATFVIAKDPESEAAKALVREVISADRFAFEIGDDMLPHMDQVEFPLDGEEPRVLFRFSNAAVPSP